MTSATGPDRGELQAACLQRLGVRGGTELLAYILGSSPQPWLSV
jgi:hypothetical protein